MVAVDEGRCLILEGGEAVTAQHTGFAISHVEV